MPEDLNEKISLFLDDELVQDEAIKLLERVHREPELEDKMRRYDVVSQAIKTEVYLPLSADFVSRVNQQIQQEPAYLLPKKNRIKRRYVGFSTAAASVAVVAVLVAQGIQNPVENDATLKISGVKSLQSDLSSNEEPQILQSSEDEKPAGLMLATNPPDQVFKTRGIGGARQTAELADNETTKQIETPADDSHFNNYLQAHNGNMFSSGENYRAFVEVANFQQ